MTFATGLLAFVLMVVSAPPAPRSTAYGISAPVWTEIGMYPVRPGQQMPPQSVEVFHSAWCLHNEQGEILTCDGGWECPQLEDCSLRHHHVTAFFTGIHQYAAHNEQGGLRWFMLFGDGTQAFGEWAGPADVDFDGLINSQDFFDFSTTWSGPGGYDFNDDAVSDTQDFFDFISHFLCCE